MILFSNTRFNHPVTVSHNGLIIAFAIAAEDSPDNKSYNDPEKAEQRNIEFNDICYRVLAVKPEVPEDDQNWSPIQKLFFPETLRPIGGNLIEVDASFANPTEGHPFKVLSDGKYVYVFRHSAKNTLLINRFLLIDTQDPFTVEPIQQLQKPWEVRYQRSQKKDIPQSLKDSPGYKNMDDNPFTEPTYELSVIDELHLGWFDVLLLPTTVPNQQRWQIFAWHDESAAIRSWSILRSKNGLFSLPTDEEDTADNLIYNTFGIQDSNEVSWQMNEGPSGLLYMQREMVTDAYGRPQILKRAARIMLAGGVFDPSENREIALNFDGDETYISFTDELDYSTDKTFSFWVYSEDYSAGSEGYLFEMEKVGENSSTQDSLKRFYLKKSGSQLTLGVKFQYGGPYESNDKTVTTSTSIEDGNNGQWINVVAICDFSSFTGPGNDKFKGYTLKIFINGQKKADSGTGSNYETSFNPTPYTDYSFLIGAQNSNGNIKSFFEGALNKVGLWNKALTTNEINELYKHGPDSLANKLIAYWPINEGSGTSIQNAEGTDYNGKIKSGTWLIPTASGVALLDFAVSADGTTAHLSDQLTLQPLSPDESPESHAYADDTGLSVTTSFLEFVKPIGGCRLLDSMDGRVHLYFTGNDNLFSGVQFDALVGRTIYELPVLRIQGEETTDGGSLQLIARRTGELMNDTDLSLTDLIDGSQPVVTLSIKAFEQTESWVIPQDLTLFYPIFSGLATDDHLQDEAFREGTALFYAYRSYRCLFIIQTTGNPIFLINRRADDQVDYDQLVAPIVEPAPDGNPDHCKLTISLTISNDQGVFETVTEIWDNMPLKVGDITLILNGQPQTYYEFTADNLGDTDVPDPASGSQLITAIAFDTEDTINLDPDNSSTGVLFTNPWASTTDPNFDDLALGSNLFSLKPVNVPDDGSTLWIDFSPLQDTDNPIQPVVGGFGGTWTPPEPNNAISFDDTESIQFFEDEYIPPNIKGNITVECWAKPTGDDFDYETILLLNQAPTTNEDDAEYDNTKLYLGLCPAQGNYALNLGNANYVNVKNVDNPPKISMSSCTIEAFVQFDEVKTGEEYGICQFDNLYFYLESDDGVYVQLKIEDDDYGLTLKSDKFSLATSNAIMAGGYHHLAFRVNFPYELSFVQAGQFSFFIDGEKKDVIDDQRFDASDGGNPDIVYYDPGADRELEYIGNYITMVPDGMGGIAYYNHYLHGRFDELRIWNTVRTDDELSENAETVYGAGESGLIGYYRFNEGAGSRVYNLNDPKDEGGNIVEDDYSWEELEEPAYPNDVLFGTERNLIRLPAETLQRNEWHHLAANFQTGYAISFNEPEHELAIAHETALNPNGALTLEAWIRIDELTSDIQPIITKFQAGDSQAGYALFVNEDDKWVFQVVRSMSDEENDPVLVQVKTSTGLITGEWIHVAGVFEAVSEADEDGVKTVVTLELFVNGQPVKDQTQTISGQINLHGASSNLFLGNTDTLTSEANQFVGWIESARVWSRGLRQNEFMQIIGSNSLPDSQDGLVAYWTIQDGEGLVVLDPVGGNDGILASDSQWKFTARSARWKVYIDGNAISQYSYANNIDFGGWGDTQYTAGAIISSDEPLNNFIGQMDELRLWARSRTPEEISDNMYRTLFGTEDDLEAYFPFLEGTEEVVYDYSSLGNNGSLSNADQWVLDALSPVCNEGPEVDNILSDTITGLEKQIWDTPSALEYGDIQFDAEGNLQGIMKRCYVYQNAKGLVELSTGFKVGDLDLEYIGQVQTDPTLMGYIEGAPPVPSENLTFGQDDPHAYRGASEVILTDATEQMQMYSTSEETGDHHNMELQAGLAMGLAGTFGGFAGLGGGVEWDLELFNVEGQIGYHYLKEIYTGQSTELGFMEGKSKSFNNQLALTGIWLNGKYQPNNVGYALVKSHTSDLYALKLKRNGTLIGYQVVVNPEIPEDWNIIMFPINPFYTKNGTLDGKVGFEFDEDYKDSEQLGSYFKPREAYALKTKIENEHQALLAYYEQLDVKVESKNDGGIPISEEWQNQAAKRNLVNTYVWTADGGLYAEEEQSLVVRNESFGGNYARESHHGFYLSAQALIAGFGAYTELDMLWGTSVNISSMKSQEESESHGVTVNLDVEGVINKKEDGYYTTDKEPGKVDAYRFMTFYLTPEKKHFDTFFDTVIDQDWLLNSTEANAKALRSAKSGENGVWRVLHRVTYVSRVPEPFPTTSAETGEAKQSTMVAGGQEGNAEIIELMEARVTALQAAEGNEVAPAVNLTMVADAIDYLMAPTEDDDTEVRFDQQIYWWTDYWTSIEGTDEGFALRQDLVTYFKSFYELD